MSQFLSHMWHTPVAHWGREVPVCLGFSRVCGGEELAWHLRVYQKQDRVRYADDRPRLLAEQDPRGQIERMGGDHDEVCRFERQRAVRDPGRRAEKQWMRGAPGDPCWRLWHGYLLLARGRAIPWGGHRTRVLRRRSGPRHQPGPQAGRPGGRVHPKRISGALRPL